MHVYWINLQKSENFIIAIQNGVTNLFHNVLQQNLLDKCNRIRPVCPHNVRHLGRDLTGIRESLKDREE